MAGQHARWQLKQRGLVKNPLRRCFLFLAGGKHYGVAVALHKPCVWQAHGTVCAAAKLVVHTVSLAGNTPHGVWRVGGGGQHLQHPHGAASKPHHCGGGANAHRPNKKRLGYKKHFGTLPCKTRTALHFNIVFGMQKCLAFYRAVFALYRTKYSAGAVAQAAWQARRKALCLR